VHKPTYPVPITDILGCFFKLNSHTTTIWISCNAK
jgi:hypothetical protein